jgi:hypothetical protein
LGSGQSSLTLLEDEALDLGQLSGLETFEISPVDWYQEPRDDRLSLGELVF